MRRLLLIPLVLTLFAAFWLWGLGGAERLGALAAQNQREVQNAMARALRGLKAGEPGALVALWTMCFAYGFFHAAGPGHGKLVIGGYGLGRRVPLGRLTGLAIASSLAQAAAAVALVYAGIFAFGWSRERMQGLADGAMFALSNVLIAGVGAWLLLRGARALWRARLRSQGADCAPAVRAAHPPHGTGHRSGHGSAEDHGLLSAVGVEYGDRSAPAHGHHAAVPGTGGAALVDHATVPGIGGAGHKDHGTVPGAGGAGHGDHGTGHAAAHAASHGAAHAHAAAAHCDTCGHAHGPTLAQAAEVRSWRDAAMVVGAIAVRPCTGALFLLILTWRLGIDWAGIAGAFVMGLGTATITVVVAIASVSVRESALAQVAGGQAAARMLALVEVLAGALVLAVALQLLLRSV